MNIIIGSRGSKLALIQSEEVKQALENIDPSLHITIKVIHTKGDQILNKPLQQIGDKGLFTQEIEKQLLNGDIDIAVHSLKDMPSLLPQGLILAGTLTPSDHRDCLIFQNHIHCIDDLPFGSIIGTGSPRRKYQLLQYRPDLKIVNIRGNVETRLQKMKEEKMDAIVLAAAGLKRLGLESSIGQYLEDDIMIPACGQGILAIEVKDNSPLLPLFNQISDPKANERLRLERLYLETIGGSCHLPIGAHVIFTDQGIDFACIYGNQKGQIERHYEHIEKDYEIRIIEIAKFMKKKVDDCE